MNLTIQLHDVPGASSVDQQHALRDLAERLQSTLAAAGFDCDDVFSSGADWTFLVEPERALVSVTVACECGDGPDACEARITGDYEGGLLDLWTPGRRREAALLLQRIEDVVSAEITPARRPA